MQVKYTSYLLGFMSMGSTTLLASLLPLLVILAPLSNVHAPLNAKLRAAPMLSTLASCADLSVGTVQWARLYRSETFARFVDAPPHGVTATSFLVSLPLPIMH
jgi:hypothetical protein